MRQVTIRLSDRCLVTTDDNNLSHLKTLILAHFFFSFLFLNLIERNALRHHQHQHRLMIVGALHSQLRCQTPITAPVDQSIVHCCPIHYGVISSSSQFFFYSFKNKFKMETTTTFLLFPPRSPPHSVSSVLLIAIVVVFFSFSYLEITTTNGSSISTFHFISSPTALNLR